MLSIKSFFISFLFVCNLRETLVVLIIFITTENSESRLQRNVKRCNTIGLISRITFFFFRREIFFRKRRKKIVFSYYIYIPRLLRGHDIIICDSMRPFWCMHVRRIHSTILRIATIWYDMKTGISFLLFSSGERITSRSPAFQSS